MIGQEMSDATPSVGHTEKYSSVAHGGFAITKRPDVPSSGFHHTSASLPAK